METNEGDSPQPKEKYFTKKRVVRWAATYSVRFVVISAVNTLVPADTKVKKVKRYIGSHILAEMVAEHVKNYVNSQFDEEEIKKDLAEMKDKASGIVEGVVVASSVIIPEKESDIIDAEIIEDEPVTSTA